MFFPGIPPTQVSKVTPFYGMLVLRIWCFSIAIILCFFYLFFWEHFFRRVLNNGFYDPISTDWKLNLGTKKMLFFDLIGSFTKGKYYRKPSKTDTVFDRARLRIVFRVRWFIFIFKLNTTTHYDYLASRWMKRNECPTLLVIYRL